MLLFCSEAKAHSVTAIAWRPVGDHFVVGLHGRIILCDQAGWTSACHMHTLGSSYSLSWSADGMRCSVACGTGAVLIGELLDVLWESSGLQVLDQLCLLGF